MAQTTAIEWTDLSWNPTHGCSKVSPGCAHCYAETLSLRYGQTPKPWTPENAAVNVLLKPRKLREPLSNSKDWRGLGAAAAAAGKTDGKLVFVNSTSDLFHEQIPDEYIADVFAVMALAPQHVFQVLTKRPERAQSLLSGDAFKFAVGAQILYAQGAAYERARARVLQPGWPLRNVWMGVSVENRRFVGRADLLRATPAAVRFISAEPLLGPLIAEHGGTLTDRDGASWADGRALDADTPELDLTGIDWLIVGGESGPGHRPMRLEWARDLRDACRQTGTAYFCKQLGGARSGTALEDLPSDLRIRDFPVAR